MYLQRSDIMTVNELLKSDIVLLDGGFGTELIKKGLKPGEDSALDVLAGVGAHLHRSLVGQCHHIVPHGGEGLFQLSAG